MANIIHRSYYDASEKGRQDAQNAQMNQLRTQGAQQDIEHQNLLSGLYRDPKATPEQFARAGRSDVANSLANIQAIPQERLKEFATQMTNAAKYGLSSPTPKAFIERNFPQLAQAYGPDWATATDDDVLAGLQDAAAKFGVQAGIAPTAPKDPNLITGVGPDGKPQRVVDGVGVPVYERPRSGISVTSPDGTEISFGGDGAPNYDAHGFSKPQIAKLEEALINSQGNAYALREQIGKYRPEFSTFAGQAKAGIASAKEKLGMENAPQQTAYLADYTAWKSDTLSLLSQYLNQLSGAAISPHEEARLKGGFPNADDGPSEYKAKAEATLRRFALVQARAAYLLSKPGQKLDSVSLDNMSNIIAMEANKLAKSYESGGMNPERAKQQAIADTRNRFRMGQ